MLTTTSIFTLFLLHTGLDIKRIAISEALAIASSDIKFGLYSAISMKESREEQIVRMKELQAMGVNTVIQGQYPPGERFKEFVHDLHEHEIKLTAMVTRSEDWYGKRGKGDFDLSKAEKKLREAAPYAEFFDYLYLAHEVHEFATHEERVKMYQLAKRHFPKTPILMYYGASIDRMEQNPNKHRYRYEAGEADIALIAVAARDQGKIDVQASQKRLAHVWDIIKRKSPNTEIWVNTSFASDDNSMRSDKTSMWSPGEIRAYGKALIQSGKLDGFFLRAYGRFTYDLGYPEWVEQRAAFASLSPIEQRVE